MRAADKVTAPPDPGTISSTLSHALPYSGERFFTTSDICTWGGYRVQDLGFQVFGFQSLGLQGFGLAWPAPSGTLAKDS